MIVSLRTAVVCVFNSPQIKVAVFVREHLFSGLGAYALKFRS